MPSFSTFFTPSKVPAHKEILRILKESPTDTISIVTLGPMTNVALAATEDPETFLRAKQLVVMGGAVHVPGNITPTAEFNTYVDPVAAARVFALTSINPASTMPPTVEGEPVLPLYPENLSRRLRLILFPLDITTPHLLMKSFLISRVGPLVAEGSPLAQWVNTFLSKTMDKIESIEGNGEEPGLSLHDPLCIWYMILQHHEAWKTYSNAEDIRIETCGQWTRGAHVVDSRIRAKLEDSSYKEFNPHLDDPSQTLTLEEVPTDTMGWLSARKGNRIHRIIGTPGETAFADDLIRRIFG